MGVPVPFSVAYVLLLLALPGVWWLGRALASSAVSERDHRGPVGAGLALAIAVLGVHIASLVTGSLRSGLPLGLLPLAAAGIGLKIARRKRLAGASEAPASRAMILTAIAAACVIAPVALRYYIHDELFLAGHMSIAAQLQNGVYPPRHATFPDVPLRYHYGFDLVSAALTALLHLRVDQAIDVATIGLFALSWCQYFSLGERLTGPRGAWVVPLVCLFGGGLPFACDERSPLVDRIVAICSVGKHYVNPPLSSYYFQHPWSLGVPLGVTTLLIFTSRTPPRSSRRLLALLLCLAALSISQITLFAGLAPSLIVAETVAGHRVQLRRGAEMLLTVALSLGAAVLLGGFFTRTPTIGGLSFSLQAGFGANIAETLLWNMQTFGLLLPLGAVGLWALGRERVVFALLILGSLVIINSLRFDASEDIMKFATLASGALGVLASAAIVRLFPDESPRGGGVWRTIKGYSLYAGPLSLMALCCFSGGVFVVAMGLRAPQVPSFFRIVPAEPTPDDVAAITMLRGRIAASDVVYRSEPAAAAYAQWGGIPVPQTQWTLWAFGFGEGRIGPREHLLRRQPNDVNAYIRQHIRYLVLDNASSADERLLGHTDEWISEGRAEQIWAQGNLVIVRLREVAQ